MALFSSLATKVSSTTVSTRTDQQNQFIASLLSAMTEDYSLRGSIPRELGEAKVKLTVLTYDKKQLPEKLQKQNASPSSDCWAQFSSHKKAIQVHEIEDYEEGCKDLPFYHVTKCEVTADRLEDLNPDDEVRIRYCTKDATTMTNTSYVVIGVLSGVLFLKAIITNSKRHNAQAQVHPPLGRDAGIET